jgi:hypothetical protein
MDGKPSERVAKKDAQKYVIITLDK